MWKTVSVVVDNYEKDWKKKNVYFRIWQVFEKDWKESIKLDKVLENYLKPLFWQDFKWWFNIFDNQESNTKETQSSDEDLPF